MQLKIQRSQRTTGVMSKSVVFCIDATAALTAEEQANVAKYKLGPQIIYSSEAHKQHAAVATGEHYQSGGSWARGMFHAIAARIALTVTVDSLQRGQHIECKSLDEVVGAEQALIEACQNLKGYLATAATFDGKEQVYDFSKDEPEIVSKAA
ncbi:MAG: hypothetical protein JOZ43_03700 [Acidobacteriales bacterium]|nr:hypothetical protein [Terriglobales bacterium]